jgi:hypothetical protein
MVFRSLRFFCFVSIAAGLVVGSSARATTIDFEGLADSSSVGSFYLSNGVTFTNAVVLTAGVSLNELEFPPHSGQNVALDGGGPITLNFSSPIDSFSGYFTYATSILVAGFDSSNNEIGSAASAFSENFTSSGNTPNELLQIVFAGGFDSVTITGDLAGSSFVMDDISFLNTGQTPPPPPPPPPGIPEPGSIWLLGSGVLAAIGARRFRGTGQK